jgi:hypothetical protein
MALPLLAVLWRLPLMGSAPVLRLLLSSNYMR